MDLSLSCPNPEYYFVPFSLQPSVLRAKRGSKELIDNGGKKEIFETGRRRISEE